MTIERRRQIKVYSGAERDWAVPIPFTRRKVEIGKEVVFSERDSAQASFHGETITVGTTTHIYEVVALDQETLGVSKTELLEPDPAFLDAMDNLSTETLKPKQVGGLKGEIVGDKITGVAFPTNGRLQTVFRYKRTK